MVSPGAVCPSRPLVTSLENMVKNLKLKCIHDTSDLTVVVTIQYVIELRVRVRTNYYGD